MKLVQPFLDKGHTVYMDNFYTSPELFHDLLERNTSASGTVRQNRKHFPALLKPVYGETARPRGTTTFAYYKQLTMVRWSDNKDVYALSTLYSDQLTTARRRVGSAVSDVPCPRIISDYNAFMGGVDLADQAMCYYSIGRKSMKWWRRVFWRMVDHVITNAYVIYSANNAHSLERIHTRVKFHLQLANDQQLLPSTSVKVQVALLHSRCLASQESTFPTGLESRSVVLCVRIRRHILVA